MNDAQRHLSLHRLSLAVALACFAWSAHAQTLVDTQLSATGSYRLDTDPHVDLFSGPSSYSVDVLSFPGSGSGPSSAVVHTYGSSYGDFGSRSSGLGSYNVDGHFSYATTILNDTGAAKFIKFRFNITPGVLSNEINSGLGGSDFVIAGLNFDIQRNGASVWHSNALLHSDAGGLGQFSYDGANLYGGTGLSRTIAGGSYEVDLGVLNAGESFNLQYDMGSFARGQSVSGSPVFVPEQRFTVPEQWVDYCGGCGYGYGGYGHLEPAHEVVIPGYWTSGSQNGSHASSGDPFSFDSDSITPHFNGRATLPAGVYSPVGFEFSVATVPEPSTYALWLAGAAGLVAWSRRRQASQR
ncbi:MAG: PEP-CTERM sorting domain-containing protein [Burkholderiales bacterium]|nr:PEP-CTERM sorting domain-containing protein [Burkholderiales bacterium]